MKYKITIGSRVFDAEMRDDGFYQLKCDKGDFKMNPDLVDAIGARIEEVKEPLRVEYDDVIKTSFITDIPITGSESLRTFVNKHVRVTVEELPAQCEHDYRNHDDSFYTCYQKCIKCGKVKR